jgi:hypothetical protein
MVMPVHDWTRVDAGLFHAFHQGWVCALADVFNTGGLPPGYFALIQPSVVGSLPGMWPLVVEGSEAESYAHRANQVSVRHERGRVAAVIEIVSPGNKDSRRALTAFVHKLADLIGAGVHLLIVDPFPPGPHDPHGIHKAIWDEIVEAEFELPPDKPLTLAAYQASPSLVAYVEPIGVGDVLPDMPLFLEPKVYVPAPLEATYQTTWNAFPAALKPLLEGPQNA